MIMAHKIVSYFQVLFNYSWPYIIIIFFPHHDHSLFSFKICCWAAIWWKLVARGSNLPTSFQNNFLFKRRKKKRINHFIFPAKVGTQCLDDDDLEQHTRRRDHPVGENFDYNKRPPRYILWWATTTTTTCLGDSHLMTCSSTYLICVCTSSLFPFFCMPSVPIAPRLH